MKKKYTFRHFMVIDGRLKEIDPSQVSRIADECKLLWANMSTGKKYVLVDKRDES